MFWIILIGVIIIAAVQATINEKKDDAKTLNQVRQEYIEISNKMEILDNKLCTFISNRERNKISDELFRLRQDREHLKDLIIKKGGKVPTASSLAAQERLEKLEIEKQKKKEFKESLIKQYGYFTSWEREMKNYNLYMGIGFSASFSSVFSKNAAYNTAASKQDPAISAGMAAGLTGSHLMGAAVGIDAIRKNAERDAQIQQLLQQAKKTGNKVDEAYIQCLNSSIKIKEIEQKVYDLAKKDGKNLSMFEFFKPEFEEAFKY